MKKLRVALVLSFLIAASLVQFAGDAAVPAAGTIDEPEEGVFWDGATYGPADTKLLSDFCGPPPACDEFRLTVDLDQGSFVGVSITTPDPATGAIPPTEGDDYDLYIYLDPDAGGPLQPTPADEVARGATASGNEEASFEHDSATPQDYLIRVMPYLIVNEGSTYDGLALASPSGGSDPDPEVDCIEGTPAAFSVNFTTPVTISVLVLLDDAPGGVTVDKPFAEALFEKANLPYTGDGTPFNPGLNAIFKPKFRVVDFGDEVDASNLIQLAKDLYGGKRPRRASLYTDVVYVLTDKDIEEAPPLGNAVAGLADCIGGVRYDHHAFAVGEAYSEPFSLVPAPSPPNPIFYTNFGAKVAAHEIGHLFGAHHHYMNCLEVPPPTDPNYGYGGDRCTLMTNFVDFTSLRFSSVNRSVVRGHALMWAAP